jgi:PAS domain S-box-containing protein
VGGTMQTSDITPDQIIRIALDALERREDRVPPDLDDLPVALYATDAQGVITFYNKACIDFSGRTPIAGHDRWCVTWKLFTDKGDPLPHDQCSMAVAIQEKRAVRGVTAVAERPDGRRVAFAPYPTPLFDSAGELVGAVNLLIDITDAREEAHLREQAWRCRRLVHMIGDAQTIRALQKLAIDYEKKASEIRSRRRPDYCSAEPF